jgi:hypothetical protein
VATSPNTTSRRDLTIDPDELGRLAEMPEKARRVGC